jgi:hypothetical protein
MLTQRRLETGSGTAASATQKLALALTADAALWKQEIKQYAAEPS